MDRRSFARYRYDHHYYRLLKHWPDYQDKFSYLDAKGQALIGYSGLLCASFLLLVGQVMAAETQTKLDFMDKLAATFAGVGFFIVVITVFFLLRTFRTFVGSGTEEIEREIRSLENIFSRDDDFGREALIDWYLSERLELIKLPKVERTKRQSEIKEILRDEGIRLEGVSRPADMIFIELRRLTEKEVTDRHWYYICAVRLTNCSLALLALSFLLAYGHDLSALVQALLVSP